MKIAVFSDLHNEFSVAEVSAGAADVVVLAGDIDIGVKGVEWAKRAFDKPVIYVPGNHEYYKGAIPRVTQKMRDCASGSNVIFLDNDVAIVDGVRFVGFTLWASMDLFGKESVRACANEAHGLMNDYRKIRVSPSFKKLSPYDTMKFHGDSMMFLRRVLADEFHGKTIVVSHHAPAALSLAEEFSKNILSGAYATNILRDDNPLDVDVWIHGHTHKCLDYVVGGTRVVSNQRGYHPDELVDGFDPAFCLDVGASMDHSSALSDEVAPP